MILVHHSALHMNVCCAIPCPCLSNIRLFHIFWMIYQEVDNTPPNQWISASWNIRKRYLYVVNCENDLNYFSYMARFQASIFRFARQLSGQRCHFQNNFDSIMSPWLIEAETKRTPFRRHFQTLFWMKVFKFRLKCHWSLFLQVL